MLSNLLYATTFPHLAVLLNGSCELTLEGEHAMNMDQIIAKLIDVHEMSTPQLVVQQNEE